MACVMCKTFPCGKRNTLTHNSSLMDAMGDLASALPKVNGAQDDAHVGKDAHVGMDVHVASNAPDVDVRLLWMALAGGCGL